MNLVNLLYLNNDFFIYNASYIDRKLDVSELLFNIQYTFFFILCNFQFISTPSKIHF